MRHQSDGSYGRATGRLVKSRIIADCWVTNEQVTEEWLVRDQASFARCLGLEPRELARQMVAQDLRDPGNLGTMLRTGDAVGAGGLILIDDCADPFSAEAVRASMGAIFTQGLAQVRWEEFVPWLRGGTGQLVAASLRDAVPYRGADYQTPCFILVGNESQGLPEAYEAECDLRVTMPMKGRADSLNAAVAGAVLAYEVLDALNR